MKLQISRKRWLRGEAAESGSYLLHPDENTMCCLGFYARACGIKPKEIRGVYTPADVSGTTRGDKVKVQKGMVKTLKGGVIDDTALADKLMNINDNWGITDEEREKKITKLFKKIGVEVEFVA